MSTHHYFIFIFCMSPSTNNKIINVFPKNTYIMLLMSIVSHERDNYIMNEQGKWQHSGRSKKRWLIQTNKMFTICVSEINVNSPGERFHHNEYEQVYHR